MDFKLHTYVENFLTSFAIFYKWGALFIDILHGKKLSTLSKKWAKVFWTFRSIEQPSVS